MENKKIISILDVNRQPYDSFYYNKQFNDKLNSYYNKDNKYQAYIKNDRLYALINAETINDFEKFHNDNIIMVGPTGPGDMWYYFRKEMSETFKEIKEVMGATGPGGGDYFSTYEKPQALTGFTCATQPETRELGNQEKDQFGRIVFDQNKIDEIENKKTLARAAVKDLLQSKVQGMTGATGPSGRTSSYYDSIEENKEKQFKLKLDYENSLAEYENTKEKAFQEIKNDNMYAFHPLMAKDLVFNINDGTNYKCYIKSSNTWDDKMFYKVNTKPSLVGSYFCPSKTLMINKNSISSIEILKSE